MLHNNGLPRGCPGSDLNRGSSFNLREPDSAENITQNIACFYYTSFVEDRIFKHTIDSLWWLIQAISFNTISILNLDFHSYSIIYISTVGTYFHFNSIVILLCVQTSTLVPLYILTSYIYHASVCNSGLIRP